MNRKRRPKAPGKNKDHRRQSKPTNDSDTTADEKLQKVLARAGLGSRREMEAWIEAGRVSVDGTIATLGDRVNINQVIRVDGKLVETSRPVRKRVIMYHKPEGEICSRQDPEGRPSVFDNLPNLRVGKWINIGRLDFNTAGLLLFTTDGELANALTHPSSEIEREYAVRVKGVASDATLKTLRKEVALDDGPARFEDIVDGGGEGENHWYYVVIREGRYREVRRMWEAVGHPVTRLIRTRYGPVILPRSLHKTRRVELEPDELELLYRAAGLPFQNSKPGQGPTGKSRRRR